MTERYLGSIISPSPVEPTGSFADQTASGVWNIHDPLLFGQASDWPVTGNIDPGKFIESIFACAAYTGTGSSLTVNTGVLNSTESTGVDLSNEGGLIWIKNRDAGDDHVLTDTERGVGKIMSSNTTSETTTDSDTVTSFNSTGFTVGADVKVNTSGEDYIAWIFRKQPKFFDVVTYSGDGLVQDKTISHNLGVTPGMVVVKRTDSGGYNWYVCHRSLGLTSKYLNWDNANAQANGPIVSAADASTVSFSRTSGFNNSGEDYVVYLFAHNDGDGGFGENGDQDIIKCGSYDGNDGTQDINVGFEPQWLMIKNASNSSNWVILDMKRNFIVNNSADSTTLRPNGSDNESSSSAGRVGPTPNGFGFVNEGGNDFNAVGSGYKYIYVAIRRGPMRTPATGPEVFDVTETGNDSNFFTTDLSTIDVNWQKQTNGSNYWFAQSRLTGERQYLKLNSNVEEATYGSDRGAWDQFTATSDPQKAKVKAYTSNSNVIYSFKRAPKFFDVVTYTGSGSSPASINHNLGVTPELLIVKNRIMGENWAVFNSTLGKTKVGFLDDGAAFGTQNTADQSTGYWGDHTSSIIQVGSHPDVGRSSESDKYIAYLFATLEGVSKVGTYSGTGSDVNVDCGFSNGSFVVIVKRTDSSGDWYIWDSNRNIVSGNDPYNIINSNAAAVDNTDYIDPLSSGFTITSNAGSDLNASGGTYVFLAIAK